MFSIDHEVENVASKHAGSFKLLKLLFSMVAT